MTVGAPCCGPVLRGRAGDQLVERVVIALAVRLGDDARPLQEVGLDRRPREHEGRVRVELELHEFPKATAVVVPRRPRVRERLGAGRS